MHVLVVTETGSAWPSGFVRALIYKKLFQEIGWNVEFQTRRSERLTRFIETTHPVGSKLLRLGLGRAIVAINRSIAQFRDATITASANKFDTIYLQKIDSFSLIQRLVKERRARLVFDLNDGLWLPHWKNFLSGNLVNTLSSVDAVTCDNPFGLAFSKRHAKQSYLVPDPAQVEAFDELRGSFTRAENPFRIGWIGSRNTASNLFLVFEALEQLFARNPQFELRILGSDGANPAMPRWENVRASFVPRYDHRTMVQEVLQMHAGLFPLFDNEDSRARGVLKATIYMSGEACVLSSPVGQCTELIRNGENGLLCDSKPAWIEGLESLAVNADLRDQISGNALNEIRRDLSLRQCFDRLCKSLKGEPV